MSTRFQRPPDGVLDRNVLCVGQPSRERLGFLRKMDHGQKYCTERDATQGACPAEMDRPERVSCRPRPRVSEGPGVTARGGYLMLMSLAWNRCVGLPVR